MDGRIGMADRRQWSREQCEAAALGDLRRARRLVRLAEQMTGHSNGSMRPQTERLGAP